jgi:hypothetical protein
MGEANRRRRADQTPQEEVFENIAAVVDTLPPSLSDCTFKALVAYQAARSFGLDDVSIGIGGLLARVGPDPVRDVITWCDSQNMGAINDSGALFLHCWLRYRDTIFDATVGDWRSVDATAAEERLGAVSLPPIQWTVTFPTYWLKRTSEVETLAARGSACIGARPVLPASPQRRGPHQEPLAGTPRSGRPNDRGNAE